MMFRAAICVLGGGPAGSSVALRLAQLGHSVIVVEKQVFPRAHVGESLTPGVLPLLETLGLSREVEQQDFLRPDRALVLWPPSHGYKSLGAWAGFQVNRAHFDDLLLSAAERHGAQLMQGAVVQALHRSRQGWQLQIRWQGLPCLLHCRFLVDATGRRSTIPVKKRRTYGRPTFALYGYWNRVEFTGAETRVEAGEQEWFWGAPLPGKCFVAAVFLDPGQLRREHGAPATQLYMSLLQRSKLLQACLKGQIRGKVSACDATSYYDQQPVTANSIRVGEASLAIDPLSSQGVQLALGSGIHAAAVIHTTLLRREASALARRFYRERQRESRMFHFARAAVLYAEAARERNAAFWQSRGCSYLGVITPVQAIPRPLPFDGKLRLDPAAKIADLPCLKGDFIGLARGLTHPGLEKPLVFLGNVAVGPLLTHLQSPKEMAELLREWSELVSNRAATAILDWLWIKGLITEAR
jgi:flavin-dependent dehydrogenase